MPRHYLFRESPVHLNWRLRLAIDRLRLAVAAFGVKTLLNWTARETTYTGVRQWANWFPCNIQSDPGANLVQLTSMSSAFAWPTPVKWAHWLWRWLVGRQKPRSQCFGPSHCCRRSRSVMCWSRSLEKNCPECHLKWKALQFHRPLGQSQGVLCHKSHVLSKMRCWFKRPNGVIIVYDSRKTWWVGCFVISCPQQHSTIGVCSMIGGPLVPVVACGRSSNSRHCSHWLV